MLSWSCLNFPHAVTTISPFVLCRLLVFLRCEVTQSCSSLLLWIKLMVERTSLRDMTCLRRQMGYPPGLSRILIVEGQIGPSQLLFLLSLLELFCSKELRLPVHVRDLIGRHAPQRHKPKIPDSWTGLILSREGGQKRTKMYEKCQKRLRRATEHCGNSTEMK